MAVVQTDPAMETRTSGRTDLMWVTDKYLIHNNDNGNL